MSESIEIFTNTHKFVTCDKCATPAFQYVDIRGHYICRDCFDDFRKAQREVLDKFDKVYFKG